MKQKDFAGYWRITETDRWEQEALDMIEPAHILFGEHSLLRMIAITAGLDCKHEGNRIDFSLLGDDDGSLLVGRGWAEIDEAGTLNGMLYIHDGDESGFTAERSDGPVVSAQAEPRHRRRR